MSTMPPIKAGTGSSKSAKNKGAPLDKRATTDNGDFMGQTYKDHYDRSVLFIKKLLERLSKYEEEVDRLNDAFAKNADLPPPKLKKSAATGSQPTNWQNEKMKLENRNKELDEQLQKTKHELAKLKSSASIQATRPRSAKSVLETDSDNDSDIWKTNLQECKNAMEKLSEEQRKTLESLERENADLKANMAKKMEEERIQRGKSDLTEDNEKLRKTLDALRQENKKMIAENQEKKKGGGKGSRTSSADEISKLQDEVDELRNRLKKMAGAQLTDNNPAIAVLSDPNRPLSLGEKFSELYENEWTDAMEEMAETMPDETKVIKLLLDIVCDAYKFCLDKSDRFMDKINSTLNGFSEEFSSSETMPKEIAKTNKDYRKRLAVYVVSFLQKDFAKEMKRKVKAKVGTQTEAYIKRCVLVCWFMTVQDPKVHITTKTTEEFDEDLYKPYTKKGKHLNYLVWPAVHLHEGGPLIGKGVAQGKP